MNRQSSIAMVSKTGMGAISTTTEDSRIVTIPVVPSTLHRQVKLTGSELLARKLRILINKCIAHIAPSSCNLIVALKGFSNELTSGLDVLL
jgi:hypothetical protein